MDTQILTVTRRPEVLTKRQDSELKTFKDFLLIHGVYKEFCRTQGSWEAFKGSTKTAWTMFRQSTLFSSIPLVKKE